MDGGWGGPRRAWPHRDEGPTDDLGADPASPSASRSADQTALADDSLFAEPLSDEPDEDDVLEDPPVDEPEDPSDEPLEGLLSDDPLFEDELYRSAYQPPPFKMKPVPREICRRAVCWWQLGHSVSAASLMDCSNSHSCWQDEHAYSYVGMGETPPGRSRAPLAPTRGGRRPSTTMVLLATCQGECQQSPDGWAGEQMRDPARFSRLART
ncbi:MAG: hypothetical protein QM820_64785 [Minicystis sp.]